MIFAVRGETYTFQLFKRKPNSAYEYEDTPACEFKGRPAGRLEKKSYRIQKGIDSSSDSIYILSTNIPEELQDGDKIKFLGKIWTVQSIGYYFENNLIADASVMSDDYLLSQCPKGFAIG